MMGVMMTMALAPLVVYGAGSDDIQVQRVFGPEQPADYKHPSCFTELDNGDLYLVYYGGSGEYGVDTKVFGARLKKGSSKWTDPVPIADTPFRSDGNGVVWQAPDGRVWLFYVVRYGDTWSESRVKLKVSDDGAHTWSDSQMLTFELGTMVQGRPILLSDGDYLLPVYHETGHDREEVGPDTMSFFLRNNPKTNEWTESSRIESAKGNLQAAPVELEPGHVIAYCRRGGGYMPTKDGWLVRAESRDGGRTWSKGENSTFPNPNAAVEFIKLKNGHLLLVYNDSTFQRTPLTVAISTDNDKTYPYRRNIKEGKGSFAYPTAVQTSDGKVHVTFTSHGRTVVNHAVFEESAILSHRVEE